MKVFTRNTECDHFVCCLVDWKCLSFQWKCPKGKCIHQESVCDGADTCGDGSDERNCGKLVFMTVVVVVVVIVAAMNGAPEQTIHRKSEGDNKSNGRDEDQWQ